MKITVDGEGFNIYKTNSINYENFPLDFFWNQYFDKNPIAKNVVTNLMDKGYRVRIDLKGNTTSC